MESTNLQNALQDVRAFRYTTESGFAVETTNSVLPVFNADEKSLFWHELAVYAFEEFWKANSILFSPPELQKVYFSRDFEISVAQWWERYERNADETWAHSSAIWVCPSELPVQALDCSTYVLENVVGNQIQFAASIFAKSEVFYIDHVPLMGGKMFLLPACEKERTEAAAKDHTTHLELLNLSREHSASNLFSTVVRELKSFGWRIWQRYSNSSWRPLSAWPRLIISRQCCAFSAAACSQTS